MEISSIIDLIIANEKMKEMIQNINIDEKRIFTLTRYEKVNGVATETPSDHNTIIMNISWTSEFKTPKSTVWNFRDNAALEKFSKISENVSMKENWLDEGNIDVKYQRWFKQLQTMMYSSFKRVTIKRNTKNNIIHKKIQYKRKLKKIQSKLVAIKQNHGIVYKHIKGKIDQTIQEILEEDQHATAESIKQRMQLIIDGTSSRDDIWSVRRKATKQVDTIMALKDEEDNIISDPMKIQERYVEYYTNLLQPRKAEKEAEETITEYEKCFSLHMQVKTYDKDKINEPFTEKELNQIIKKLKKNKSPGEDGIPNELIQAFGCNLKQSLLNMMNWMHKNEAIPSDLQKINIKSLYKGKGQTSDLKNHRGIFISSAILKMYEGLIAERTAPVIEKKGFTQMQAGGRKNRSIADQIFILRCIMDHYKYLKKPIYLEFIDLVKAFDKMILKNVMLDLWQAGVRGKIWRNIYLINKTANIRIRTPMGLTNSTEIGETLKQGSVLASTLAALHTDGVSRFFKNSEAGVSYGNAKIHQLLFQDDILKIEDDPLKLNNSNVIYTWFSKINRMLYHDEKSMFMTTNKEKPVLKLAGNEIKEAEKYKYLAEIITPSSKLNETIKQRKNQVIGLTTELATIISLIDETGLHIETAKKYYETVILPKLLTNAETWNKLTTEDISELEGIQNRAIKRLLRLPQGTPSQGLLNELGIWNIQTMILFKKLMYLHKISNYPEENLTRKVLMSQINQPGTTWFNSLDEESKNLNIKLDLEKIQQISKYTWKKEVKEKLTIHQSKIFMNWSKTSKKCAYMQPTEKIQNYLIMTSKENSITILKERLKMTDVRANYKNKYSETSCRICHQVEETSKHLLACYYKDDPEKLKTATTSEEIIKNISTAKIEDIKKLAQILQQVLLALASTPDAVQTDTDGDGTVLQK